MLLPVIIYRFGIIVLKTQESGSFNRIKTGKCNNWVSSFSWARRIFAFIFRHKAKKPVPCSKQNIMRIKTEILSFHINSTEVQSILSPARTNILYRKQVPVNEIQVTVAAMMDDVFLCWHNFFCIYRFLDCAMNRDWRLRYPSALEKVLKSCFFLALVLWERKGLVKLSHEYFLIFHNL